MSVSARVQVIQGGRRSLAQSFGPVFRPVFRPVVRSRSGSFSMRTFTLLAVVLLLGADDPSNQAAKDELRQLAGTWQVVPLDGAEGDKDAQAAAKKLKLTIEGDKYTVLSDGKVVEEGTLTIDPSKTPKTMDMKVTKGECTGRVVECIYRLDKDALLVATALPGKARPVNFEVTRDSGRTKLVREREKKD